MSEWQAECRSRFQHDLAAKIQRDMNLFVWLCKFMANLVEHIRAVKVCIVKSSGNVVLLSGLYLFPFLFKMEGTDADRRNRRSDGRDRSSGRAKSRSRPPFPPLLRRRHCNRPTDQRATPAFKIPTFAAVEEREREE